jgi:hypothetical protein
MVFAPSVAKNAKSRESDLGEEYCAQTLSDADQLRVTLPLPKPSHVATLEIADAHQATMHRFLEREPAKKIELSSGEYAESTNPALITRYDNGDL